MRRRVKGSQNTQTAAPDAIQAIQVVDLCHARQQLWEVARRLFPKEEGKQKGVDEVIRSASWIMGKSKNWSVYSPHSNPINLKFDWQARQDRADLIIDGGEPVDTVRRQAECPVFIACLVFMVFKCPGRRTRLHFGTARRNDPSMDGRLARNTLGST